MKVKATKAYKELQVLDTELWRIPEEGEIFEVSEERAKILMGDNAYKTAFVELVEKIKNPPLEIADEVPLETPSEPKPKKRTARARKPKAERL